MSSLPALAGVATTLLVVAVDQAAKRLAVGGDLSGPWIEPVRNVDLALGVAGGPATLEILGAILGIALLLRLVRPRRDDAVTTVAIGLAVGGALGNLVDRLAAGSVVDFIPLGPIVFNPADVAILAGLALAASARLRGGRPAPVGRSA